MWLRRPPALVRSVTRTVTVRVHADDGRDGWVPARSLAQWRSAAHGEGSPGDRRTAESDPSSAESLLTWVRTTLLVSVEWPRARSPTRYNHLARMTSAPQAADSMLQKITDALDEIRAEEFDYEILQAASDVLGQDTVKTWRPSLSYLPPEYRDGEYHVTIYAKGACETCPIKKSHVATIEPKVRALVGADNIFVHDYYDWFDNQYTLPYGE
jgi:hypothetical protein